MAKDSKPVLEDVVEEATPVLDPPKESSVALTPSSGVVAGTAAVLPERSAAGGVPVALEDGEGDGPSLRDGSVTGREVLSDGVCPLIAEGETVRRGSEVLTLGGVDVVTRTDDRVMSNPVTCPSCGKVVESHQLTWDPSNASGRDCAMALAAKGHPEGKRVLGALADGDEEKAKRISRRHPLGERLLGLFGWRTSGA